MFGKPKHGWVDIDIGEYRGHGSYLTDIHYDFLDAAVHALRNNVPFVLYIDEEGCDTFVTSYYADTFVNRVTDKVETYHSNIGFQDLIDEGVSDIERYLEDWAMYWGYDDDDDAETIRDRIETMQSMIAEIRGYLQCRSVQPVLN